MNERYAHVLIPGDVVSSDSRSAVLMVARELVRAHRARGRTATLVASVSAVRGGADEAVLPVLQGEIGYGVRARARNVFEGHVLGHRPTFTRAYRGLETVTDVDVVLVHNRPEGLRATPPGAYRVLYLHNDALRYYSGRELRELHRHVDLVVCVSRSLADRLPDALAVPHAVVLNGVDTDVFRPADRIPADDLPTVLFCGRVIEDKGVHLLIEAAARLRHLPFRVRVVGAGDTGERLSAYERRLRRTVAAHGLDDRVCFERSLPRSEVVAALRQSDVLAVPSTWPDPCPLVMLEGLACGLAIVAARAGGIPELGADACRYHVPDDIAGLTEQLELLIGDADARHALAGAARRRALELDWATSEETLVRAIAEQAAR